MIVHLGGQEPAAVVAQLEHAIEAVRPKRASRKTPISTTQKRLQRGRLRAKVLGTEKMRAALLRVLKALRDRVLDAKLHEADQPKGSRPATRRDIDDWISASNSWSDDTFAAEVEAILKGLFDDSVASAEHEVASMGKIAARTGFNVTPKAAIDAVLTAELEFSKEWVQRERDALKSMLLDALTDGPSIRDLTTQIRDHFGDGVHIIADGGNVTRVVPDDSWAEMVARTETNRAFNAGQMLVYQNVGVAQVQWHTSEDERTCPICEPLDEEIVDIGEAFPNVGVTQPPAHPSCRCGTTAALSDDRNEAV